MAEKFPVTVWAKVSEDVAHEVEQMATGEDRSISYVVRRLIESGLKCSSQGPGDAKN